MYSRLMNLLAYRSLSSLLNLRQNLLVFLKALSRYFILLGGLLLWATVSNAANIEVKGLFGGAAVLVIDGREQLLKQGQVSREGVELISANATKAVVRVEGESRTLYLSERIGSKFEIAEKGRVFIPMNPNRQYFAHGSVNGRSVRFLVDTGANTVALNATMARSLGISLADGVKINATTASSNETVTRVLIREISVGEIKRNNVEAVVLSGTHPPEILLGMSFLEYVEISKNNDMMVLTSKM
jgi:aspartyl protease family protein